MNKLLIRQLQKHFGETDDIPGCFKKLLEVISESYDHYEKDRKLIERSIELSSKEMIELNIELKKEKEELKKAHKELNTLFENIDEVLFSVDMVEYKLLQMSAGCKKIYGYTLEEFFDDRELWRKIIHPDDGYQISQQFNDLRQGRPVFNQYRIIHKDKSIRWVENKVMPTLDKNGWIIRIDGVTNDITSRKLAEIELEKSFSIIEATLESTADGILVVDSNNKITKFNTKFLELWQMPREILDSGEKNSIEFVLNQLVDPEAFVARVQQLYNSEEEVDFDLVHFKDGRVVERYSQPQLINKKYVGRVWSFRDITERKRAEENIRISEEKRALIMNSALDAIICIDLNGAISFWNHQAGAIFGWSENEVMGKQLSGFIIPEEFRERHHAGMAHYLKIDQGPAINTLLELTAVKRNGEEFPIELAIRSIKQSGEEFFCAFIRDITERKKGERDILISNERYNLVAKATSDVIWDWNLKTNTVIRNAENMKKIFGYDIDEVNETAAFWTNLIHPEDLPKINEGLKAVFNNPSEMYMDSEYRLKKADGHYAYIYDKGFIVRDKTGEPIRMIGACQDITKLKENELQLQKHAKELALSNEELEQFAYVASHDLQEPLRMVTSFLTQLEKKYGAVLDDKGKKYIDFAVDGAKRMRKIILDLLDYSRAGRTLDDMENIDLNELIQEIKILFRKEIEEKKAVILSSKLPLLTGYSSPLRQIFQNLIGNALKYCSEDRSVEIKITVDELADYWQFSVTDNGIGIDKEYFDRIFVIFQRLHNRDEYSGTGMGLAITKKIVENMGGKIWLVSEEGNGSTFYFTLQKKPS
ncbi:MAG: PAS domain S-box protein [Chitinophagaceae bacterium]